MKSLSYKHTSDGVLHKRCYESSTKFIIKRVIKSLFNKDVDLQILLNLWMYKYFPSV